MTLLAKRKERSIVPRMYYITTAIDYTNGPPHIGHAYEKVLADVLARWHRMKGEEVYFLTGVDQHGQKVQQTAEKLGITPQEFFDADAEQPKELSKLISDLKKLNKRQLENIADIVNDLANGNRR